MAVSVSIKGKPGTAIAVVPARRLPERKESPPVPKRRKQAKKNKQQPQRVKLIDPLVRLTNKARGLIARSATRWGTPELERSCSIRDSVSKLIADGQYPRNKAEGILRDLDRIITQVRERIAQTKRGTGEQHSHPDRNVINEYSAAGGSITFVTARRKNK